MTQIYKKKKEKGSQFWKQKDSSDNIFHVIFNHSERNGKNHREKYWQDVLVNLSENISSATKTMTQKLFIYLLGMSNHIFINFTIPICCIIFLICSF